MQTEAEYQKFVTGLLAPINHETINRIKIDDVGQFAGFIADALSVCDAPKKRMFYGKSKPSDLEEAYRMQNEVLSLHSYGGIEGIVDSEDFNGWPEPVKTKVITKLQRLHSVMGVMGEVAELFSSEVIQTCDMLIELKESGTLDNVDAYIDPPNAIEELGDIQFYLTALMAQYGTTTSDVVRANMAKLLRRFPSSQFSLEDSLNRNKEEEAKAIKKVEVSQISPQVWKGVEIWWHGYYWYFDLAGTRYKEFSSLKEAADMIDKLTEPKVVVSGLKEVKETEAGSELALINSIREQFAQEPKMMMEYSMVYREPIKQLCSLVESLVTRLDALEKDRSDILTKYSALKAMADTIG